MIQKWLCVMALALVPALASAERDASKVYVFGNSLVHHLSETSDHTNVPHWLNQMAKADDKALALDGQWGFLRNFADGLPPSANWGFPGVKGAWSPGQGAFGDAQFDAVLVTPANFIQYQLPDAPYDGDNPTGESPFGAALRLLDWVKGQHGGTRLFIYEGWSAMDEIAPSFPPGPQAIAQYHAINQGAYHQWYLDLINSIETARPGIEVELIPVASVLSGLFAKGGVLDGIPVQDLYQDNSPHGTPTLYLLAAMVTYAYLYDAPPPEAFQPPAVLHPELVSQYSQVADAIWQAKPKRQSTADSVAPAAAAVAPDGDAPAGGDAAAVVVDLPERQPVSLPPSGVVPVGIPALGMGLNGISDWSTQHPFIDLMKSSRGWVGHLPDRWGGVSTDELRAAGHLNVDGWPVSLPDNVRALESVLLTDQPVSATALRGKYFVTYKGTGKLRIVGRAKRVQYGEGTAQFQYEPGEGVVGVSITETDADDPIRDITIVHEDHLTLHEAGVLFNPAWIDLVKHMRSVRFMDWMLTNGSPVSSWDTRPRMSDASWTQWGVPLEVMIDLANQIGADPWFNMPHLANDDYVRKFAEQVHRDLDPRLRAYVEFSNEVWNQIFPQAAWAQGKARALWGESDTGWMQFYGLRSAQIMAIWGDVFGDETKERLMRVAATHTGWPGLEESILLAPLAFLQLGHTPVENFDAYAVTGYFGYEMGTPEMAQRMNTWLDRAEEIAQQAGEAQGLRRVALREFVKENRFDPAIAPVAIALQEGSLRQLVDEVFPYHASAARKAGLKLIMYEGGTHVSGVGTQVNDERLTEFFTAFNYTPEMAKLYEILLSGWAAAGGTLFQAFVDVAPATKWGSWGALRHLQDQNPRWDMLMAFNASGPRDWEARDRKAFEDGVYRVTTSNDRRLIGTEHEDILIGGPGNDALVSGGGDDIVHGGPGLDQVVLPGVQGDYTFARENGRFIATGPSGKVTATRAETVAFEGSPLEIAVSITDLLGE